MSKKKTRKRYKANNSLKYIFFILLILAATVLIILFKLNILAANGGKGGSGGKVTTPTPTPITVEVPIVTGVPATTTAPNILPNASFETDANGDKIPDGWTWEPGSLRRGEGLQCSLASEGSCAFKVVAFGSHHRMLRIDFFITPTYIAHSRLTVDSKPMSASPNTISASFKEPNGNVQPANMIILPEGTKDMFTTSSQTLNYAQPFTATSVSVMMGFDGPSGAIDYDNVKLELFQ